MDMNILFDAVIDGNKDLVVRSIHESIEQGTNPDEILQDGIIRGMAEVGVCSKKGSILFLRCWWLPVR